MRLTKLDDDFKIWDNENVKLFSMGNISAIKYNSSPSKGGTTKKLNKDEYLDITSGEVKEFNHIENRSQDLRSVARSLAQGRDIINANVVDVQKCRWLTLTYKENMTDPKKLRKDFEHLNTKLRDFYGPYEYICAAEPQGRGAWHLHVLLIFKNSAPFMENIIVRFFWKRGFVTVKKLKNVDNVGAYLSAYLGDIDLDNFKDCFPNGSGHSFSVQSVDVLDDDGNVITKHYVKGARLSMYPPGFHIFRYSKGIVKPDFKVVKYSEARSSVSGVLTYRKAVNVSDDSGFDTDLVYEYYNSKRVVVNE